MEKIELFRPSNGTHGDCFMAGHCFKCAKWPESPEAKQQCMIFLRTQAFDVEDKEYPRQWRYVDGEPTCTAFKDREEFNAERRAKRKPKFISVSGDDLFDSPAPPEQASGADQFCDSHCTHMDHHPDCVRAEQASGEKRECQCAHIGPCICGWQPADGGEERK